MCIRDRINLINELKKCFGFNKFKGNQEAIIQNLLDGRDTFVLMLSLIHISLFDSLSVLDNVMFPLNMFSNDTLRERTKRAMFCLDRVNLTEAKDCLLYTSPSITNCPSTFFLRDGCYIRLACQMSFILLFVMS